MTHADWTGKGSLLAVGAALLMGGQDATAQSKLGKINHIVVLYLENRSFDNLYGEFPGADGLSHGAFGGSFLNHIWLIAAGTPLFPNAPASIVARLDEAGRQVKFGTVTPDGYGVNTIQSVNTPHQAAAQETLMPSIKRPTIGDRLSDRGIAW